VIDGDSLWRIAARHLATSRPEAPLSDREIARYWVQVVGLNRASLTSKNPDVIFPGEVIVLPPVDG
jgi:nucleoid-associated protein YgaU